MNYNWKESLPLRAGRFGYKVTKKIGYVNIFFFGSLFLIYGERYI